ncbi:MAG: hypothetical protein WC205_16990 [Opitutaceae bacterium]|jgi:hypothetical protein
MAYEWTEFTDYLDGTRVIRKEERDELWEALAYILEYCGDLWQLKASDMTAIKASRFLTDLTSVEDPDDIADPVIGDLAKVLIDIEGTFTGTTGYDAFKAVRADEGIDSDAKLAEIIGGGGRVSPIEDYHLWNLYKRVLTALQCCPTTAPIIEYDSISKSQGPWGWASPTEAGRYFKEINYSGSFTVSFYNALETTAPNCGSGSFLYGENTTTASGSATWLEPNPASISNSVSQVCHSRERNSSYDEEGALVPGDWSDGDPYDVGSIPAVAVCGGGGGSVTQGATYQSIAGVGGCVYVATKTSASSSGEVRNDFTNELTIDDVVAAVDDAIAAEGFDDDWNDTAGAYRNKDEDALSASARLARARFKLSSMPDGELIVGHTYRLRYLIRTTPLSGGASTDGTETYVEFTFTSGMDVTSGYVSLAVPASNATVLVVFLGWLCEPFAP